jgi:lactate dehydrogenase-like 2-hydroxyacid dehydrogenase
MPKPTLLVTRKLPDAIEARARDEFDARLNPDDAPWFRDGAEIARRAEGCDAVLCAAGDPMGEATIAALPRSVRMVTTFSVGTDHIALAAAKARGIRVSNTPEVLSFATAETAFTLMLMAARRAGEGERMVRAGQWEGWAPTQLMGVTLEGKRLGVLGFGRIGRELARMCRSAMRMEVHYRDIRRAADEEGATFHETDESFLGAIDVLSMHVPGGEGTRKWLNAERLAMLRPGAVVVNSGRGNSVDDAALCAALKSGHVRAAGLDVYDGEPKVFPGYFELENVALLPHLGSATIETRLAMGQRCLDNLAALLIRNEEPPHAVV